MADALRDGHQRRRERGGRGGRGAAAEAEEAERASAPRRPSTAVANADEAEPIDRTDDPVRMYLREMGSVELLSREGEIAIAKRIEAGRDMMIGGLCESPLTFQAIIVWRDELNDGRMLLRDIIDLEATYGGPATPSAPPEAGAAAEAESAAATARTKPPTPTPRRDDDEDDGEDSRCRCPRMEAELKPEVLATFDAIADALQEAAQAAGPAGRDRDCSGEDADAALRSSATRSCKDELVADVEVAVAATTTASRRWSSSSTTSTSG